MIHSKYWLTVSPLNKSDCLFNTGSNEVFQETKKFNVYRYANYPSFFRYVYTADAVIDR